MENIIDYKHTFKTKNQEIELTINYINGCWKCELTKGNTGTGTCTGSSCTSLKEYIQEMERQHMYSASFFNR